MAYCRRCADPNLDCSEHAVRPGPDLSRINVVRLQEECAELIHILCKIERFGINAQNPKDGSDCMQRLVQETADVLVCIGNLKLDGPTVRKAMREKREKLLRNRDKELI